MTESTDTKAEVQELNGGFPDCPSCGSHKTFRPQVLRPRPSLLYVLLFDWLFLLIRWAFLKKTATCSACGYEFRYRTRGSRIAIWLLVIIVIVILIDAQQN